MSEFELPDEIGRWPSNPHELLGIKSNSNPTDVKRAYTRLIRRFKPEHFPEHFRRLREAYDAIKDRSSLNHENWDRFPRSTQSATETSQNRPERSLVTKTKSLNSDRDPFASLWRQAESGQITEVLDRLRSDEWFDLKLEQAKLMEYWLTNLQYPDPANPTAARILLSNFHHFKPTFELISIARVELHAHPELAELIDLEKCALDSTWSSNIQDIIRIRWEGTQRTLNFSLIRADYELLADRFFDRHDLRDGIAIQAASHLIWSPDVHDEAKTKKLIEELESISGLQPIVSAALERFEYAIRIRSNLQLCISQHPNWISLLKVVPWMWNEMDLDFPKVASDWLVAAVNDPSDALALFDFLCFAEPLRVFLVHHFELVIRRYAFDENAQTVDEQLTMDSVEQSLPPDLFEIVLLEEFLGSHASEPYERFRILVLEFCILQHISAEKMASYIKNSKSSYARLFRIKFLKKLEDDQGLQSLLKLLLQCAIATSVH